MDNTQTKIAYYQLESLLQYHQYQAVMNELKNIPQLNNDNIEQLLTLAHAIVTIDMEQVKALAQETAFQGVLNGSKLERKAYYALQNMTLQIERNELADYLRGLTPLLVDVLRLAIEKDFFPELSDYMQPIRKNSDDGIHLYRGLQWSKDKIEQDDNLVAQTWDKYYRDFFNYDNYVSSSHLLKIIEMHSKNEKLVELAMKLRNIEKYLRNLVAHEVVMVDEQFFIDRMQLKPKQVHQVLLNMYDLIGLDNHLQRNSLQMLRQAIFEALTAQFNSSIEE